MFSASRNSAFSMLQEERQHCSSLLVKRPDMLISSPADQQSILNGVPTLIPKKTN